MATHLILQKIFKTGFVSEPAPEADSSLRTREQALHADILKVFGESVSIRHVDAGSCNGCELEIHAINGPHYNIEGMGVKFVASPRHA
ncbi:MAG: formate hydrogenlyase, partial [Betaproteobacteria bacterium HGW-Betaproteobacteria-17]